MIGDVKVVVVCGCWMLLVLLGVLFGIDMIVNLVMFGILVIVLICEGNYVLGVDEVLDIEELVVKLVVLVVMVMGVYVG